MTTYKIYKNMITVTFDDSNLVIFSDSQIKKVFSFLLSDFSLYYLSLPCSAGKYYYYVYQMIEKFQSLSVSLEHQIIVDLLRNFLVIVVRHNFPNFRIIFVNEI